jgi:hypothetical protein
VQAQNIYVNGAPIVQGVTSILAAGGSNSSGLLDQNNNLVPGLSVNLLGSTAQVTGLRAFAPGNPYVALDVMPGLAASGPQHLFFNTPGNLYVRPSAFQVVESPPPTVSALGPANGGTGVAISGQNFNAGTQVLFDGLPAAIQSQSGNILIVTPPFAPAGYTAAVAAFNPDGQSSLLLNPTSPATYTYPSGANWTVPANPSLIVSPGVIPAGGAVTVDVTATNSNFQKGVTTVGFGTSDVIVGSINVLSANHLTVSVTPNVTISAANITVTTGLEVISQAVSAPVTPADTTQSQ